MVTSVSVVSGPTVALLDDPLESLLAADDPAQAGRIGHLGGQQGCRVAVPLVPLDQGGQGLRPDQRQVAVEDHDGTGGVRRQ
jgi:hypothetical protein